MMAKLIFERAVMLGIFLGSPVFIKLRKSFRNADSIMMHHDIGPLIVIVLRQGFL